MHAARREDLPPALNYDIGPSLVNVTRLDPREPTQSFVIETMLEKRDEPGEGTPMIEVHPRAFGRVLVRAEVLAPE